MAYKLGIIGMNEGNGHPYSYSAMFNGFDADALQKYCEFELIREYLPANLKPEDLVQSAKVEYVWAQEVHIASRISKVSLIPNVVEKLDELIDKSDAIILARDDPWNREFVLEKLLRSGKPLFVDKLICSKPEEFQKFRDSISNKQLLMATSAARYTPQVQALTKEFNFDDLQSIHGVSRVNWLRYGSHLLEPIVALIGENFDWVRSLDQRSGHDVIQLKHASGINVILECHSNLSLPIGSNFYFEKREPITVLFDDFYHSFNYMMHEFASMIETGKEPYDRSQVYKINEIILAGDRSKQTGGAKIDVR